MSAIRYALPALTALAVALPATLIAGGPQSWEFDIATTGQDVFWTSPTTVQTDAARYEAVYQITLVEVDVTWLIFDITLDVTDQVPPEVLMSTTIADGPLPVTVVDQPIVFPAPPDAPALAADIAVTLDAAGFGQLSATNIVFGNAEFEIPGFGTQLADIQGFRVAGVVDVFPRGPLGDLNDDFVVNVTDLLALLANWGACPAPCPPSCVGDLDGDCNVSTTDLLQQLANWG